MLNINDFDYIRIEDKTNTFSKRLSWIFCDTIRIVDRNGNSLATCTRTNMCWNDYKIFVSKTDEVIINDYLIFKLSEIMSKYINQYVTHVIWCAFEDVSDIEFLRTEDKSLQLIEKYLNLMQTKIKFNFFDLELCGMFMKGMSIMSQFGYKILHRI